MTKNKKEHDLAIIITNYNTKDLLDNCLSSVFKANHSPKGIEVIVVDNASNDGSVKMVEKKYPQVKLIESRQNLGFSKGNNLAAASSDSDYLLFLNSDTVIEKDALVKPLKYLKNHPKTGALTIKLILNNGEIDYDNRRGFPTPWNTFCRLFGLSKLFPQSTFFNAYHLGFKPIKKPTPIPVIAGSFFMISNKVFEKIGRWDEDYFFYGEDIDLCYRLKEAGYQVTYYPKVSTLHLKGASSGIRKETKEITQASQKTKLKTTKASIKAWELFVLKHYALKYPKLFIKFLLFGITLKGKLRLLKLKLKK